MKSSSLTGTFFILTLCGMLAFSASAQDYSFRDRLFFGGNLGLTVGSYTDIELSPHAGYYITPRWAAGVGITYEYYNNKYHWIDMNGSGIRYETNIYGGRLFTNYVILNNINDWIPLGFNFRIFVHAEYEILSYEKKFFDYDATGRELQKSFLVGGGLRFPSGKRSSTNITFLWNLNSDLSSFYGNGPIIRIGYNF